MNGNDPKTRQDKTRQDKCCRSAKHCQVLGMLDIDGSLEIARRVYNPRFLSPCLNAHSGDTIPKILVENR